MASKKEVKVKAKKAAVKVEKTKFVVVQGKALTTKRGVKANGEEVLPTDVNGGEEVLNKLVESGHLVKV